ADTGPSSARADVLTLSLAPGERWWGGRVTDALAMPLGQRPFECDLAGQEPAPGERAPGSNQASPLLLSSAGRSVHSVRRFIFRCGGGVVEVEGEDLRVQSAGDGRRAHFRGVIGGPIRPSGSIPHRALCTGPQYNSGIEQPDLPTQSGVLDYVRR